MTTRRENGAGRVGTIISSATLRNVACPQAPPPIRFISQLMTSKSHHRRFPHRFNAGGPRVAASCGSTVKENRSCRLRPFWLRCDIYVCLVHPYNLDLHPCYVNTRAQIAVASSAWSRLCSWWLGLRQGRRAETAACQLCATLSKTTGHRCCVWWNFGMRLRSPSLGIVATSIVPSIAIARASAIQPQSSAHILRTGIQVMFFFLTPAER